MYNYKSVKILGVRKMQKKKRMKYRLGLLVIISFLIMLMSFLAYMANTSLEEVLYDERGVQVVTHSDDSSES